MISDQFNIPSGPVLWVHLSQTLPSIDVLVPKVKLFNDYVLLNAEDFNDMRMWHYGEERSPDYMPGPIPANLVSEGVFVFLGNRQPANEIDYQKIPAVCWVRPSFKLNLKVGLTPRPRTPRPRTP